MKRISILGSTGSIGTQALQIIRENPQKYRVCALSCRSNTELLKAQTAEFRPQYAVVSHRAEAESLQEEMKETGTRFLYGEEGLVTIASAVDCDVVLNALVGMSGLKPTYNAVLRKKNLALANKETLVAGGELIMKTAARTGAVILPVDSEHSAVFQCLKGYDRSQAEKIILTASGGPFRGKKAKDLKSVTLSQALNHPRWKMGSKITIDSATLMNKGFEVIEAKWLFGMAPEAIDVVVHPESIVHSLVEYCDGAVMAQLGLPDMAIPISLAFEYPKRLPNRLPRLDLKKAGSLTFEAPDMETFPCLKFAYDALKAGKTYCAALNAANEVAVAAFLEERIAFCDISDCLDEVLQRHVPSESGDLESIIRADEEARRMARHILEV